MIKTHYSKTVPFPGHIINDTAVLEYDYNGYHIKVIDANEIDFNQDVNYPVNYLLKKPTVRTTASEANYCHDIIFNMINYLHFLESYGLSLKTKILIAIANVTDLDNAYWNGYYFVFGGGKLPHKALVSSTIISHEMTHCLLEGLCDLDYYWHSGALNESFCDVFGVIFENYIHKKYQTLGFLIGSECNFLLRNMADPHACRQPCRINDPLYYRGTQDNRGVHINSGITNYIFYRVTEKIGLDNAFSIFLNVLLRLNSKSDLYDFKRVFRTVDSRFDEILDDCI
jgi:Zn-dependent metalloprotease